MYLLRVCICLILAFSYMQICMEKTPYYVHIYVLHLILLPGIKEKSIVNKNIQRENIQSCCTVVILGEIP